MPAQEPATTRFAAEPECSGAARRFVVAAVQGWDLERFEDDAALCATELATNAILHSRTPFTVSVRPAGSGIRIDVQDDRPDRLPELPPPGIEPLQTGTTGRGLKLVATIAARWGYFSTELAKTVWAEVDDDSTRSTHAAVDPLIEVAPRRTSPDARKIRFLGLPVQTALASGVQVDDLVREVQLHPDRLSDEEKAGFLDLLDRSGPPRLAGRHAAFRAAAEGVDRFDLDLEVSPDEVKSVAGLSELLEGLASRAVLEGPGVEPDVAAMRAWLAEEAARQLRGEEPTFYPG